MGLITIAVVLLAGWLAGRTAAAEEIRTLPLRQTGDTGVYSLLYSVKTPSRLGVDGRTHVQIEQEGTVLAAKTLHVGDPDFYVVFRALKRGDAVLRIDARDNAAPAGHSLRALPRSEHFESEPNNRWQDANPIRLGTVVFASADDVPYVPLPGTRPQATLTSESGDDWFRFSFDGRAPKLVFFQIEVTDRDNIPMDVAVFRQVDGKAVAYNEGEDPVTLPHEVQALPGNKFTTRVLSDAGDYFVRVRANHPEYKLRTRVYDPPPYADPRQAVRTAVDYLVGAGDSWHANTPRRGGLFDRVGSAHQETTLCVACHPTHFTQRAQLLAAKNGYPVVQRPQLQFLAERFYNNPRPFYGFEAEGAVWSRVISAAANVLSRMSVLLDLYETQVSGERRERFHRGVREYLKLYYAGRDKLPPDETNGNTPLVSTYEVAWYAWRVTRDPAIAALAEQDDHKNLIDLCYQTLALADIDRVRHAGKIRRNAERILALQRPDGRWSMKFEPESPAVEFQTGHALWALHAAGIPKDEPRVHQALQYLLERQQAFGGWMDPLQSYENFRTPFRESQFAVLALSAYFPGPQSGRGWQAAAPETWPADEAATLLALDAVWDPPSESTLQRIAAAAGSPEPLVRREALETLGRVAPQRFLPLLVKSLSDPSKLVQRSAAWALRQAGHRAPAQAKDTLLAALASPAERMRWGATRVFAQHFADLAQEPALAGALARRLEDDSPVVRMDTVKALWQFWYWCPDPAARGRLEDAVLAALARPQHPWVERNLQEAVYNLADENIRYFYNNWVPLLARAGDRRRVIDGRLAVEARLAAKFAQVLESGSELQKKRLLGGLADFWLRRGDVYDLAADLTQVKPPLYSRIGNDVEQIAFFGESNARMAKALLPLLESDDSEMRRLAVRASLVVREVKFPGVNEAAGPAGEARERAGRAALRQAPDFAEVRKAFDRPAPAAAATAAKPPATRYGRPDSAYFRGYVEPILQTRGKDGYACVHCHASHTIFNGTLSTVMNVVDLNDPENSLLLRKPTASAETEGIVGPARVAHGGGIRFEKGSPEYKTILDWIKGAQ